ncbi:doxx family protein [Arenibacter sp. GZD96]|uniref:hypothetical protein n=1 Tax=Aurantibrevibacter litoralis TaxID=3106030 RepID=UPI002AFE687F|nr:hypothetical protein [Arenibacter sp. GZD-96]MEA1785207.1 doxx family protein [Arenibacter sp. GZD-96]
MKLQQTKNTALLNKIRQNSFLAISIGLVYLWFGYLKFFHGLSPAEGLAKDTIHALTFGLIPSNMSIVLLAIMEVGIGIVLIVNVFRKKIIILALLHLACTFTPLLLFSEASFAISPYVPTLLGQYIAKNIIIVGALLVLFREENKLAVRAKN